MASPTESLQRELGEAGRALSTSTVLFHQLVAQRLQLNDSDHKCLDLLVRAGGMTAGELAERSGFTTGAVTGIVNRLRKRGLIRRVVDKADRRRVLLSPAGETVQAKMWPLLAPMVERMGALHRRYKPAELRLLLDYLQACEAILRECASELAKGDKG